MPPSARFGLLLGTLVFAFFCIISCDRPNDKRSAVTLPDGLVVGDGLDLAGYTPRYDEMLVRPQIVPNPPKGFLKTASAVLPSAQPGKTYFVMQLGEFGLPFILRVRVDLAGTKVKLSIINPQSFGPGYGPLVTSGDQLLLSTDARAKSAPPTAEELAEGLTSVDLYPLFQLAPIGNKPPQAPLTAWKKSAVFFLPTENTTVNLTRAAKPVWPWLFPTAAALQLANSTSDLNGATGDPCSKFTETEGQAISWTDWQLRALDPGCYDCWKGHADPFVPPYNIWGQDQTCGIYGNCHNAANQCVAANPQQRGILSCNQDLVGDPEDVAYGHTACWEVVGKTACIYNWGIAQCWCVDQENKRPPNLSVDPGRKFALDACEGQTKSPYVLPTGVLTEEPGIHSCVATTFYLDSRKKAAEINPRDLAFEPLASRFDTDEKRKTGQKNCTDCCDQRAEFWILYTLEEANNAWDAAYRKAKSSGRSEKASQAAARKAQTARRMAIKSEQDKFQSNCKSQCTAFLTPPPTNNTLRVSLQGSGKGKVASRPIGIDCGSTCAKDFLATETVLLTPTAIVGSKFVSWSGCTGVSTATKACSVSMATAKTVIAKFDLINSPNPTASPKPSMSPNPSTSPSVLACSVNKQAAFSPNAPVISASFSACRVTRFKLKAAANCAPTLMGVAFTPTSANSYSLVSQSVVGSQLIAEYVVANAPTLTNLKFQFSGRYSCQVSIEVR